MKSFFRSKIFLSLIVGISFFVAQLITIDDYNIMWDARTRFIRGQAYLTYFLSGKETYGQVPTTRDYIRYWKDYGGGDIKKLEARLSTDPNFRRSIYQDEVHNFWWYTRVKDVIGHPPFSDIGAAFSNKIFYEKLGWLRDDHAYSLFSVILASILVGVIFLWMSQQYGLIAGSVSAFILASSSIFWSQSHYNIKDIPLLVFFTLSIWAFYKGIVKHQLKWILISIFMTSFAFSTKFNIVFLPFIVLPWFIVYFFKQSKEKKIRLVKWWPFALLYPITSITVFYLTFPQIWSDPINKFIGVINYYLGIGTNIDYAPQMRTYLNFSTYPSEWILYTTYPLVLVLAFIAVGWWILKIRGKDLFPLLLIIWLSVPIIRSSLPNTSIYGGARLIIEYLPAVSMLAGFGAYILTGFLSFQKKIIVIVGLIILFTPYVFSLWKMHPAESAYFNSLVGGLEGAKRKNIPDWGNTNGGIYSKAIEWLNKNAQKNSHLAVGFSETADFFIPAFRKDLIPDNRFSGYLQEGEYIIALTHNSELEHTYRMLYPEIFLNPLYEYKVDSVPLIKIWKNEKKYLKPDILSLTENRITIKPEKKENFLYWDMGEESRLIVLNLQFNQSKKCASLNNGYFQISQDGEHWKVLPETYPGGTIEALGQQPKDNSLIAPIAGLSARYIKFFIEPYNACTFEIEKSTITTLR